jgi:hypothetical protein
MPAKIGVIFYSTYGHVSQLAEEIIKCVSLDPFSCFVCGTDRVPHGRGVESTGAEVRPFQM